jgi:hypothetical protein
VKKTKERLFTYVLEIFFYKTSFANVITVDLKKIASEVRTEMHSAQERHYLLAFVNELMNRKFLD